MSEGQADAAAAEIANRLGEVRQRIDDAARSAGRAPQSVTLVAVTKSHPSARAEAALAEGHRVFGENRVQEAEAKWTVLKERFPDVELHLIGPLQTNKARDAVALFDVIETVDRPRLARALANQMDRLDRRPSCLIEVNTGEEEQKAGVMPAAADAFIEQCTTEFGLPVLGLMCIPPMDEEPALHFALLAEIARRNGLETLSMGMTADFESAIHMGATHVRIGTAIFGPREATVEEPG